MKGYDYVVAQDGSGDFRTLQEALDATGKKDGHWWDWLHWPRCMFCTGRLGVHRISRASVWFAHDGCAYSLNRPWPWVKG